MLTDDQWGVVCRYNHIVVPEDGLGTGLSKLPEYAPKLLEFIEEQLKDLEEFNPCD